MDQKGRNQQEKDTTERAMGAGRKTRDHIVKWNQMTALRLFTVSSMSGYGGDSRHPRPPFGVHTTGVIVDI